mmetsp:Transcript_6279/g.22354  ORF Transcript_6279/g.22354 Transcript_6279/m.22354 type:complete len:402 (-) Transcript_6279:1959-3164(-)
MEAEHSSARQGLTRLWNVVCRVLREGNLLDNIFGSCTRCLPVRGDRQLSTVSSESNYSAIPSQTERNLLAAEAAQQGGDISVPPQLHKYFEGEREGSNNDQDPFEEAGQQCNICAGETKFNTHFSVSCRHSACRDCWETWLKEHTTCMVCCEKVQKIQRFSNDLVPSEKDHSNEHIQGDNGCSDDINYRLEQVSNAFMRSLVDVKSRFNDVRERLDEIKAHLNRKNMSFMHGDARLSVTSVEASSLLEQLHVLEAIMQAPPGSRPQTASPVCLLDETARLGDMVKDFNVYLDRCVQEQENQEQLSVDSKQKPQIAMKLLSSCSPPVVLSQWRFEVWLWACLIISSPERYCGSWTKFSKKPSLRSWRILTCMDTVRQECGCSLNEWNKNRMSSGWMSKKTFR